MKTNGIRLIVAFLAGLCINSNAFAVEKIYIPFFELINVPAEYQYSTVHLLKSYIEEQGKYSVAIPPKGDSIVVQPSLEKCQATAKSLNCDYVLIGDLNKIGETIILTFAMYPTNSNIPTWNDRLKASKSDDFDPILQRLARSLGTKNKATTDGDIYSVTDYQSTKLKKVKSTQAYGISVIAASFISKPFTEDAFSSGIGGFWLYDTREMMYDANLALLFLGKSNIYQIGIQANRPLSSEGNTPYFGGGVGIGATGFSKGDYSGDYKSGMLLFLGGGYLFGRNSDVGLRVGLQYFIGTYKMDNPDKSLPQGFMLKIELYNSQITKYLYRGY
ncbi:MAG: hypothetical protein NT007_09950 [Candidatus Kapabacteria bacterium]|nr:hypothetical protein [Candidatus Kapabacteria bacterium]